MNTKKQYFYGYKITNLINNHFYYGIHSTYNLDDGYMGSGTRLGYAYKKYGIENFKKEIIQYFDNIEDMILWEQEIVTESLTKDPNCYNIQIGGKYVQSLNMIPVIDENGDIKKVYRDDPKYLSGEYKYMFTGKTVVRDDKGNIFAIDCDKIPNNCHGIQYHKTTVKDKNGNIFSVSCDDPRIKTKEFVSINKDKIVVKDGDKFKSITREEFNNGNYEFMFKNTIIVNDHGVNKRVSLNDPKYLAGEYKSLYKGKSLYKDKNGKHFICNVNDERVLSGELVGITKGNKLSDEHVKKISRNQKNRIRINDGKSNKYVRKNELDDYLNNGWKLGYIPHIYTKEEQQIINKKISQKNKGKIYIHKEEVEKIIYKYELDNYLQLGWKKGQSEKRNYAVAQGKKWINNDVEQKYVQLNEIETYIKNGWKLGMIKRSKICLK